MRTDTPTADPSALRDLLRDRWTARVAEAVVDGDEIAELHAQRRLAELEAGEPILVTAYDLPDGFRRRVSPHDVFVLALDDSLRRARTSE